MNTIDSHRVETNMIALGQTVRYQPATAIPTGEFMSRIEALVNEIYNLADSANIQIASHLMMRYTNATAQVVPASALEALAALEYELRRTYHTLGLSQLSCHAFDAQHEAEMSYVWPDGKLHQDVDGHFIGPPTCFEPDMVKVLRTHAVQPTLFEDPKPSEIIQDTNT